MAKAVDFVIDYSLLNIRYSHCRVRARSIRRSLVRSPDPFAPPGRKRMEKGRSRISAFSMFSAVHAVIEGEDGRE
jgi:hypothetical protein